ncbi:MAG: DUF2804 domain-containing protein [Gammaproteobacteria bacterium]|uniref:DUF2804 domain-containing protein n=1 Tax=Rhodoferax sp. TaxID=50421 RepID=UPI0017E6F4A3|nr:DUF2804 domain-containing protein [Rhodoferax sp.]MBU3899639.1 DUF2804 domain-containing protein [Gammaproteobacteria bacterium]MBA3056562.1 DUF2804 domain-containing protein [Rhodoferax sp.]MBU3998970.1 DUF2804 domain-containing protein [Gammaproteobacteria bacterium]MBU4018115.1 DUF2804 domain-containing protein [Gammaproteobacteria bacterium]MBU4080194.1 DUF2804 domain-containing protein [Gammaproteobacteria bacterium]
MPLSALPLVLPIAPATLIDAQGQLTMGRFCGQTGDIDWARLGPPLARSAWWRHFHHKCWQYVALATDEFFCAVAMVDVGWTSTAFAYVFDRRQARVVAEFSQDGLPGFGARVAARCGAGACHHFHVGGHHIECLHVVSRACYELRLRSKGFEIDAEFADVGPLLLAVGPVAGGAVHATQKSSGLALRGELRLGSSRHSLNSGVASFDYSNGLLARETAWRWASAHSLAIGFNLQAGYFGDQENALWLHGQIIPLGHAVFEFDPENPMAPWHIHTTDGLLDLEFIAQGLRREDKDLWVAASRYVQPIGVFNGWVKAGPDAPRHVIQGLVGVTEDHQSRW